MQIKAKRKNRMQAAEYSAINFRRQPQKTALKAVFCKLHFWQT
jgi:hypothetical protein